MVDRTAVAEGELLVGFLDWYRTVVEHKVEDLSFADAARVVTPSGLSPLGIVKHLHAVEQNWLEQVFEGRDVDLPLGTDEDPDDAGPSFRVTEDDSVDAVVAAYRAGGETLRRVVESNTLDDRSASEVPWYGHVTLRWVLVHLLEETARHAGHLDLMREQIDGRTGD
ncbi:MAG TPA: DinB family protein [Acidimicrobiia bacterium]